MGSLAIVLIVIAVGMLILGVAVQGAHILFWLGIFVAVIAVITYLAGRNGGPPP